MVLVPEIVKITNFVHANVKNEHQWWQSSWAHLAVLERSYDQLSAFSSILNAFFKFWAQNCPLGVQIHI